MENTHTLPTGYFFTTNQKVFDHVVLHLKTQNKQALHPNGECAYRTKDGSACAMGCCIPETTKTDKLRGKSIVGLKADHPRIYSRIFSGAVDIRYLFALQVTHDTYENWKQWERELKAIAREYKLKWPKTV